MSDFPNDVNIPEYTPHATYVYGDYVQVLLPNEIDPESEDVSESYYLCRCINENGIQDAPEQFNDADWQNFGLVMGGTGYAHIDDTRVEFWDDSYMHTEGGTFTGEVDYNIPNKTIRARKPFQFKKGSNDNNGDLFALQGGQGTTVINSGDLTTNESSINSILDTVSSTKHVSGSTNVDNNRNIVSTEQSNDLIFASKRETVFVGKQGNELVEKVRIPQDKRYIFEIPDIDTESDEDFRDIQALNKDGNRVGVIRFNNNNGTHGISIIPINSQNTNIGGMNIYVDRNESPEQLHVVRNAFPTNPVANEIPTVGWIAGSNSNLVHRRGDEEIEGKKTFKNNELILKNISDSNFFYKTSDKRIDLTQDLTNTSTNIYYSGIFTADKNGRELGYARSGVYRNTNNSKNTTRFEIFANDPDPTHTSQLGNRIHTSIILNTDGTADNRKIDLNSNYINIYGTVTSTLNIRAGTHLLSGNGLYFHNPSSQADQYAGRIYKGYDTSNNYSYYSFELLNQNNNTTLGNRIILKDNKDIVIYTSEYIDLSGKVTYLTLKPKPNNSAPLEGGEIKFGSGTGEPNASKDLYLDRYNGTLRMFGYASDNTSTTLFTADFQNKKITLNSPNGNIINGTTTFTDDVYHNNSKAIYLRNSTNQYNGFLYKQGSGTLAIGLNNQNNSDWNGNYIQFTQDKKINIAAGNGINFNNGIISNIWMNKSAPWITLKNLDIDISTTIGNAKYSTLYIADKNNNELGYMRHYASESNGTKYSALEFISIDPIITHYNNRILGANNIEYVHSSNDTTNNVRIWRYNDTNYYTFGANANPAVGANVCSNINCTTVVTTVSQVGSTRKNAALTIRSNGTTQTAYLNFTPATTTSQTDTNLTTTGWVNKENSGTTYYNNIVHISGTEIISGAKKFTNAIYRKITNIDSTTTPSSTIYSSGIIFTDNRETSIGYLGPVQFASSNNIENRLGVCRSVNGTMTYSEIGIFMQPNGTTYTSAPTPSLHDNSTKIATTNWVNTKFIEIVSSLPSNPGADSWYAIEE